MVDIRTRLLNTLGRIFRINADLFRLGEKRRVHKRKAKRRRYFSFTGSFLFAVSQKFLSQ
jgi:hypothetical protein